MNPPDVLFGVRSDIGDVSVSRYLVKEACPKPPVLSSASHEANIKDALRNFIQNFRGENDEDSYLTCLYSLYNKRKVVSSVPDSRGWIGRSGFCILPIKVVDVEKFDPMLFQWICEFPAELIAYSDEIVAQLVGERILPDLTVDAANRLGVRCIFFCHNEVHTLRDIDPTRLERLVAVKGTCIRVSAVLPHMQIATFVCTGTLASREVDGGLVGHTSKCRHEVSVPVVDDHVEEPIRCPSCGQRNTFLLEHERCVFSGKQFLKIQENPQSIPEGETPQTIFVYVHDDLIDSVKPGDRIEITGIFKAAPIRRNIRTRTVRSVFRVCISALYLEKDSSDSAKLVLYNDEDEEGDAAFDEMAAEHSQIWGSTMIKPQIIDRIKGLSQSPNCYQILTDSLAPGVWEYGDVKKGILCQLFGATPEYAGVEVGGCRKRVRARGEIHILLCGDPSTAKSQLLQYVHKLSPRGVYAVGRGTSAVGLTASVTRDPETKDFVLEGGAVVLSDRGVCCIDEFDKMDDNTRAILHEVMEQQSVSMAKAGIVCTLNARTAILASANPIKSRWDMGKSIVDNVNLPPSLMSRFDLIYLMLDTQNDLLDRRLAAHLCDIYVQKNVEIRNEEFTNSSTILNRDFFTQYVSYARRFCHPTLSPASTEYVINSYIELRKSCGSDGRRINATPRQLDSLVRLSKALARMKLSQEVTASDVAEACRLIRAGLFKSLEDPFTGRINMDQLHAGISEAVRARQAELGTILQETLHNCADEAGLRRSDILQALETQIQQKHLEPLAHREFESTLRELVDSNMLIKTGVYYKWNDIF